MEDDNTAALHCRASVNCVTWSRINQFLSFARRGPKRIGTGTSKTRSQSAFFQALLHRSVHEAHTCGGTGNPGSGDPGAWFRRARRSEAEGWVLAHAAG